MIITLFAVLVFLVFALLGGTIGYLSMAVQEKEGKTEKTVAVILGSVVGLVISWLLYSFAPVTLMVPFVVFLCGTIGMLTAARKDMSTSRTVIAVIAGSIVGLVVAVAVFQLGIWLLDLSV
jgi:hypothetical protein